MSSKGGNLGMYKSKVLRVLCQHNIFFGGKIEIETMKNKKYYNSTEGKNRWSFILKKKNKRTKTGKAKETNLIGIPSAS